MPVVFQRLRARKLGQWALAYLAAAWIAYEALSLLSDNFAWPPVIIRTITVILGAGLLLTLILGWYHGERGRQRVSVAELILIALVGVMAIGGIAWVARPQSGAATETRTAAPVERNSIAVLPLVSLSDDRDDAYFADGIHEEILTQLAKLEGLKVISRTSVLRYRDRAHDLREIGRALGVAAVLEGSVRRAGDSIRVTAQLIDAATDKHLWAETYDGDASAVFAIQRSIAREIATALHVKLAASAGADSQPTQNRLAYDYYLRARSYHTRATWRLEDLQAAEQLYLRAAELDPQFAQAHARLSELRTLTHWAHPGRLPDRLSAAKAALDRAAALQPDLLEVRVAAGYYHYWGFRDYGRAEAEFDAALRIAPGSGEVHAAIAAVQRRRGQWRAAVANWQRAADLDPLNTTILADLAVTYEQLERYADAVATWNRMLAAAPDMHDVALHRAFMFFLWHGETDSIAATLARLPAGLSGPHWPAPHVTLALVRRDTAAALRALATVRDEMIRSPDHAPYPRALLAAWVHKARGDTTAARLAFDSARVLLERERFALFSLGLVYAGLGRKQDALRVARQLAEELPPARDAYSGKGRLLSSAMIHAHAGDIDHAFDLLERMAGGVPRANYHELRLDPLWEPLRNHSRFERLLELTAPPPHVP